MSEHLGYEPYDPAGRGAGNSRNGSYPKKVATESGEVELRVPRDRNATFEPATVPKHARRLDGLSGNVISLYAKGLTTGDIQSHLLEIYGTEISRETISKITDTIVDDMVAWQSLAERANGRDRVRLDLTKCGESGSGINASAAATDQPAGPCPYREVGRRSQMSFVHRGDSGPPCTGCLRALVSFSGPR